MTYNFLITPTKTGTYTPPSLTIPSNGAVHKTQPLKLRVVAANSEERKGGVSDYAFVRLVVGKNTAYVGEPVPVEIQLFLQNGRYNMPELSAEGFNMTDYPEPKSSRAQRGNAIFQVRTFQTAATPVKSGALQIGPVKMDVVLKIRQNQRRRSPFNDPFEGLLTRYQDVPATLEAKAHNITVKPLPVEGRPANFYGAVGQFAMTAKASPSRSPSEIRSLSTSSFPGGHGRFPDPAQVGLARLQELRTIHLVGASRSAWPERHQGFRAGYHPGERLHHRGAKNRTGLFPSGGGNVHDTESGAVPPEGQPQRQAVAFPPRPLPEIIQLE